MSQGQLKLECLPGGVLVIMDAGNRKIIRLRSLKATRAIQRRILVLHKRHEWSKRIRQIVGVWNCFQRQSDVDDWALWAQSRSTSWRLRCRASVNAIRRGAWIPRTDRYIAGRDSRLDDSWEHAFCKIGKIKTTKWSKRDEWGKWSINKATGHRKRMRNRAERREKADNQLNA